MPMSVSGMANQIVTALNAQFGAPADSAAQLKLATAIATGVINHITANALVTTTDVGAVTSGAGAGGTVAATGTGTVS